MGWPATRLTEILGIRYPVVQAPMAATATAPELVAAVSNSGGLGSIGAAAMEPDRLRDAIATVRALTDRPFAVNLFAPHERTEPSRDVVAGVDAVLAPFRREIGLPEPERTGRIVPPYRFEELLEIVAEERVPVFSFTFGIPPLDLVRETAIVMGTATSAREAAALEAAGAQVIVAQGGDAGGHRGTFIGTFEESLVGTLALVPQVVDAVSIPVVAAGGIADGRGIAASLALGADGAQLGTAFLVCPESGAPDVYRRAVLAAPETATAITRAQSGRPARAIRTPISEQLEAAAIELAPYPAQGQLLRDLRAAGAELFREDLLFLLAGQASGLTRELPAAALVQTLVSETEEAIRRLG